jgi:xanthine/uracil permease
MAHFFGEGHKMFRGGLYALLAVVGLVFALAAIGTDLARWSGSAWHESTNWKSTVWQICGRVYQDDHVETCYSATDHAIACTPMKDNFRALQCFYILTCIVLVTAIGFAILDHGNVRDFKHYKHILFGLAGGTVACSLLGWAIAIGTVRSHFCDSDANNSWEAMLDQPHFEWGASPFLLLITTLLAIGMTVVAYKAPDRATEELQPLETEAEA